MDLITRQRHERRAAVLAAAREMIAEFGYAGVTVRDLAERCGVSVPTLYNQFGDKDGVLSAAIEAHFLEVLSSTPMTAREPGYERLVIIIDQILSVLNILPGDSGSPLLSMSGNRYYGSRWAGIGPPAITRGGDRFSRTSLATPARFIMTSMDLELV